MASIQFIDTCLDTLCLAVYANDDDSIRVVKNIINIYRKELAAINNDTTIQCVMFAVDDIVSTAIDVNNESDVSTLIFKLESNVVLQSNVEILNRIKDIIRNRAANISPKRIDKLKKKISNWIVWYKGNTAIRKMFNKSMKCSATADDMEQEVLLNDMLTQAKELITTYEDNATDETIEFIDASNPESVLKAITRHRKQTNEGCLKTGLVGVNKMFGSHGGPVLGESIAFAASSHNYKSGMLMNFARWICTLNKPPVELHGKKAAVVFISLENEADENLMQWFRDSYAQLNHRSPEGLTDEQIMDFIVRTYSQNGISLLIYRKLGEVFGYNEWVKLHADLEKSGYLILASILDYITLMKLEVEGDNPAKALQKLGQKIVNYAKHNKFLFVTGLQLDSKAAELESSGITYVVKKYGASHLADCKGLKREFDVLIFMYIEKNQRDEVFLTLKIDKHRYVSNTPPKDKVPAYKFGQYGIDDDYGTGMSKASYDIYNDADKSDETVVKIDIPANVFTSVA